MVLLTKDDADENCPVCKSSRYLNPNIKFLMNPVCYHKMCESCVDRLFTQGPGQCPVVGCGKTLRKNKFRKQTFEDVAVEREVDIRRRVAKTFNKRRDDFDTLLDYNNYLEEVEEITFNLVNDVDVSGTEEKLQAYEAANKDLINANAARAAAEMQAIAQATEAEREEHRLAREAAARELEEEKREQEEAKRATLNALANGDTDAVKIIQQVQLKRSSERKRRQAEEQQRAKAAAQGRSLLKSSLLAGSRKKVVEEEETFDPLGGLDDTSKYYVVQDYYENKWLDACRNDVTMQAGGFFVEEYYRRSLFEAFAGLTCFVNEEQTKHEVDKAPDLTDCTLVDAVS